jgi:hypothetical protein
LATRRSLVNVRSIETAVPWESNAGIDIDVTAPGAASPARLPPSLATPVCAGGRRSPTRICTGPIGAFVSIAPPALACQPCTIPPSAVVRLPVASRLNAPARVKLCVPLLLITKNPSPWMARSLLRPVFCKEPWVNDCTVPARLAPRPICAGLVPPSPAVGAPAPFRVWVSRSEKIGIELLKPIVETLAMSLPTTSSMSW